jgi:hypothetical protein
MPTRQRVDDLISYIEAGRIEEAIQEFYHDDVEMRENLNAPTIGKDANLAREKEWTATIKEVHENRPTFVAVDGEQVALGWVFDYTNSDGQRIRGDQVALQDWRGDKIARERFVYDPTSAVVEQEVAA